MNTLKITLKDTPIFVIHYKKMTERKAFLDKWFFDHTVSPTWITEGQREDITTNVLEKYYLYDEKQCFGRRLSLGEHILSKNYKIVPIILYYMIVIILLSMVC